MRISAVIGAAARASRNEHPSVVRLREIFVHEHGMPLEEANNMIDFLFGHVIDAAGSMYLEGNVGRLNRIARLRNQLARHIDNILGLEGAGQRLSVDELNQIFNSLRDDVAGIQDPATFLAGNDAITPDTIRGATDAASSILGVHEPVRPHVAQWIDNLPPADRQLLQHAATDAESALLRVIQAESEAASAARVAELRQGLGRNGWTEADIDRVVTLAQELAYERVRAERLPGGVEYTARLQALARLEPAVRALVEGDRYLENLARENPTLLAEFAEAFNERGGGSRSDFRAYIRHRMVTHISGLLGEFSATFALGGELVFLKSPGLDVTIPGTDMVGVLHNGQIWLIDNKAVSASTLSEVSSLTANIVENIADDAADISRTTSGAEGSPLVTHAAERLRNASSEITTLVAGMSREQIASMEVQTQIQAILARYNIRRVVTDAGSDLTGLSTSLRAMGIDLELTSVRPEVVPTAAASSTISPGTRLANIPHWLRRRRPAGIPRPAPVAVVQVEPTASLQPGQYFIRGDHSAVACGVVGYSPGRQGFEQLLDLGSELGLYRYDRAHDQGSITGTEFPIIRHAPEVVNREFQATGIEQFIADLHPELVDGARLILTTDSSIHPGTTLLSEITYKLDVELNGQRYRVYEAGITVSADTTNPRIGISAHEFLPPESFLKPRE